RLPAESRLTSLPIRAVLTVRMPLVVCSAIVPALPVVVSGPLTVSDWALTRLKFAALKLPSVPIRFAPVSVVLPTELPVKLVAAMLPLPPSLIAPAEVSVVAVPFTAPLIAKLPLVVVSAVLAPPLSGPVTLRDCALVSAKPAALKLPSIPMWFTPFSVVARPDWPVRVLAVMLPLPPSLIAPADFKVVAVPFTAPLMARSPVVVVSVVLAPPLSGPVTVRDCTLVRAKLAALKLPSVPMWFVPVSVVAPADWPVSVLAVMLPLPPSLIAPADFKVVVLPLTAPLIARLPLVVISEVLAPPLTGPVTLRDCALVNAKPAALKLPSVPIRFASLSVVLPTELPVRVPAVSTPPVWLMVPPDASSTVVPLTLLLSARLPAESRLTSLPIRAVLTVRMPLVVCSPIVPALPVVVSGPLTVSDWALTRLKFAALKLPSVPIRFAPVSVVLPTELPVKLVAVITPAVWLMLRPALSVTVLPIRLLARNRSELAPVVVSVRLPAPPLADGALLTVSVCASLKLKLPPVVNAPSASTWFAPVSVVSPDELPVSVAAVMVPVPLIVPVDSRSTMPPVAFNALFNVILPAVSLFVPLPTEDAARLNACTPLFSVTAWLPLLLRLTVPLKLLPGLLSAIALAPALKFDAPVTLNAPPWVMSPPLVVTYRPPAPMVRALAKNVPLPTL